MANQEVDQGKRRFLIAATAAMGGAATVAVAVPFVKSMLPSERAKAAGAPVEVDVSKIETGAMITVEWQGKPVWIVNRSKEIGGSRCVENRDWRHDYGGMAGQTGMDR
jgi:ubiquinol-cytochrome c reductase iron-sulfur subunit